MISAARIFLLTLPTSILVDWMRQMPEYNELRNKDEKMDTVIEGKFFFKKFSMKRD